MVLSLTLYHFDQIFMCCIIADFNLESNLSPSNFVMSTGLQNKALACLP